MSIMKNYTKLSVPANLLESHYNDDAIEQDTSPVIVNSSAELSPVDMETSFRLDYAKELRLKKQQVNDKNRGFHELDDEMRGVRQQMMRTPGRKGEIIKEEEISKEFARRYFEVSK